MITLFLENVASLESGAEAIEGLAGFPDPESDGVESSSQSAHLPLEFFTELGVFWLRVLRLGKVLKREIASLIKGAFVLRVEDPHCLWSMDPVELAEFTTESTRAFSPFCPFLISYFLYFSFRIFFISRQ